MNKKNSDSVNKISNILFTGSSGYIGKLLVKRLREQNYRVYEFDIKNNPNQDVRNTELLRDLIQSQKIHCVYHLAANRNVDACQNNQNALSINRDCAVALANICDFLNVRFIFTSTCAVNDVQNDYSLAKQQAEKAFPKSATILRLTNVVGAYYVFEDLLFDISIEGFCKMAVRHFGQVQYQVYTLEAPDSLDKILEDILLELFPTQLPHHGNIEAFEFVERAIPVIQKVNDNSSAKKLYVVE